MFCLVSQFPALVSPHPHVLHSAFEKTTGNVAKLSVPKSFSPKLTVLVAAIERTSRQSEEDFQSSFNLIPGSTSEASPALGALMRHLTQKKEAHVAFLVPLNVLLRRV